MLQDLGLPPSCVAQSELFGPLRIGRSGRRQVGPRPSPPSACNSELGGATCARGLLVLTHLQLRMLPLSLSLFQFQSCHWWGVDLLDTLGRVGGSVVFSSERELFAICFLFEDRKRYLCALGDWVSVPQAARCAGGVCLPDVYDRVRLGARLEFGRWRSGRILVVLVSCKVCFSCYPGRWCADVHGCVRFAKLGRWC